TLGENNRLYINLRGYIKMSNLLEKALMELSDGSREKMTDLTSITKRMTDLASIITKRMTPCPNCRVLLPPDATQHVCVMEVITFE
ncbi:hypothetical protein DP895_25915, partial [Escherichia coli]|nr:hypothetical protein [Escherichia coli]